MDNKQEMQMIGACQGPQEDQQSKLIFLFYVHDTRSHIRSCPLKKIPRCYNFWTTDRLSEVPQIDSYYLKSQEWMKTTEIVITHKENLPNYDLYIFTTYFLIIKCMCALHME